MAQKKNRNNLATISARVQGYHEGGWSGYDREAYAYMGFESNKYFTSDRYIVLDDNHKRTDGKPVKGFGLEIETECENINNTTTLAFFLREIAFRDFPRDLFKLQSDGSLEGESSAECITQIMSKEFIRNNYPAFKTMFETYFPAGGISAGSSNCGMHVNISNACFGASQKTQDEAIRKLFYFVNTNYALACSLFRRNSRATHYCARMHEDARTMDLSSFGSSHGVCFNLGHYNAGRVELRLVGGQKNYASFRNTMETVFYLVDACKRLSWADMDNLKKVFAGCNQFVFSRLKLANDENVLSASVIEALAPTITTEEIL